MTDWPNPAVIGFTLNVVGLFFLASAITFKKPRREIEEILGVERQRSLFTVRDHLVNQTQTYIGFVFLVVGHVLLMGHQLRSSAGPGDPVNNLDLVVIVLVLLASTVATMVVLKIAQLLFARRNFRRLLGEVLRDSHYELERNQKVAVQIGELLQVPKGRDEAVPDYIGKVRQALGLEDDDSPPRSVRARVARTTEGSRV